jgi:hypothetical protein
MKNYFFVLILILSTTFGWSQAELNGVPKNGPIITFENEIYNYGTIEEGADGTGTFNFTNTGNKPLILSNVKTSCGCLVPWWTKDPILPGGKATIRVRYYTKRIGPINKSITVVSNAINAPVKVLRVKGTVLPLKKE